METFEPVMREEGRHILFFVNWMAWWRRNMPWWRRPWFELKVVAVWVSIIWERLRAARRVDSRGSPGDDRAATERPARESPAGASEGIPSGDNRTGREGIPSGDKNFAMTGSQHLGIDLNFKQVAAICLEENDRRLAPYDSRLIRPRFVPMLARLAMKLMRDEPVAAKPASE